MDMFFKKNSFKGKLISAFVIASVVPVILMNVFSYFNSSRIIRENVTELTQANLNQAKSSLVVSIDSYGDLLYHIYTDDEIIELVEKINTIEMNDSHKEESDLANYKKQLRKTLRGLFYTKEYINAITIITNNNTVVFYDQLTASTTETSWMENMELTKEQLNEEISADNSTHIISTQYATTFAAESYYLFHLGHRFINYKDVDKQIGIVILSVDEQLLREVCAVADAGELNEINSFNFLVDSEGRVVSYIDSQQLSKKIMNPDSSQEQKIEAYEEFVRQSGVFSESSTITVYSYHAEELGWDIVNVSSQSKVMERLNDQIKVIALTVLFSLIAVTTIILFLTKHLTGSIEKVVATMKVAGEGELSARVTVDAKMPVEVESIAKQFNKTLGKLEISISKEKDANEKQRQAEIRALEAQINPHFLYNTLDTINWMAIDHDEYEISNAINALAQILRYGIDHSNGIVSVRDEIGWLKQYIFLQQTRLKNTFQTEIHVEPGLMDYPIHKMLLQPFIENSFIHGFKVMGEDYKLAISIIHEKEYFVFCIKDNGIGMDASMVEEINKGIFREPDDKNHIGMENAIMRIKMYYGESAKVEVKSTLNIGTEISIYIPDELKMR